MRSPKDSMAVASREQLQELVALLVERVDTADQQVVEPTWTPPTRPFVREASVDGEDGALCWRPRTGPGIRERRSDTLEWYAEGRSPAADRERRPGAARSPAGRDTLDERESPTFTVECSVGESRFARLEVLNAW